MNLTIINKNADFWDYKSDTQYPVLFEKGYEVDDDNAIYDYLNKRRNAVYPKIVTIGDSVTGGILLGNYLSDNF